LNEWLIWCYCLDALHKDRLFFFFNLWLYDPFLSSSQLPIFINYLKLHHWSYAFTVIDPVRFFSSPAAPSFTLGTEVDKPFLCFTNFEASLTVTNISMSNERYFSFFISLTTYAMQSIVGIVHFDIVYLRNYR
jgi:hypothetical protein